MREEKLITKFLDWYYKEGAKNPMRFETDHDDIAKMFLIENPLPTQSHSLVSEDERKVLYSAANDLIVERLFRFYDLKPNTREAIIQAMIDFRLLSTLLVKEGEKDSEDLALKFAEWINENYIPAFERKDWLHKNPKDRTDFLSTSELLQIFKQEQQKTGNNG